jgi:hypothetical protein
MSEKKSPTYDKDWFMSDELRPPGRSPWFPSDEVQHYDKDWLKEENDRRRALGKPPLRERKRNAVERERLRAEQRIVSPMMAADINPDYELVEACPETRQPVRERARRALAALFSSEIPDAATLPNKLLVDKVNAWLKTQGLSIVDERTIRRAAGRP